jgi:hypothetical protein
MVADIRAARDGSGSTAQKKRCAWPMLSFEAAQPYLVNCNNLCTIWSTKRIYGRFLEIIFILERLHEWWYSLDFEPWMLFDGIQTGNLKAQTMQNGHIA